MAHEMNPDKPGVMIYFKIRGLIKRMTQEQKGNLLDAILDYGEFGKKADFLSDALLDSVFDGSICPDMEQDDERFTQKSIGRKYANYVKWSQKYEAYYVEREEWESLGCPTFLEVKKKLLQMDSSGETWNRMDVFYSIWNPIPIPQSHPLSLSSSSSQTEAETMPPPDGGAEAGSAAERPAAAFDPLPPSLDGALTKWVMHWEQVKRQTFPQSSRNALREEFRAYAGEYDAEAVVKLIDTAVSNAWKTVPWDRLERWRQEAPPAKKGAGRPSEAGKYAQELAERRRKKQ